MTGDGTNASPLSVRASNMVGNISILNNDGFYTPAVAPLPDYTQGTTVITGNGTWTATERGMLKRTIVATNVTNYMTSTITVNGFVIWQQ